MESLYKVQTRFLFHANIKIKIPSEYDEEVLDVLFGILEEVDRSIIPIQRIRSLTG